jgi:hypothetical protein
VSDFEELLNKIRQDRLPKYGQLDWDGATRTVTETVQFETSPQDSDDLVRSRALRYLEQLTPEERAQAKVEVITRDGRPVRAVLRGSTAALSPERLQEMRGRAGLK